MEFIGKTNELLLLAEVSMDNSHLLKQSIDSGLTILWNRKEGTCLHIDGMPYILSANQIIFLTEFHQVEVKEIAEAYLIRFNRPFYCIKDNDSEVSCKGLLFFGASQVPQINVEENDLEKFEILWRMFAMEMELKDHLQYEMLQMMLKRLIILCTRIYRDQQEVERMNEKKLNVVREFNYLVENHFRTLHTVADYADLLHKSPKTLSNHFARYNQKTPLQVIQERIILEARRLLYYTEKPVKEIAYALGYEDLPSFSRFFKTKEGTSPRDFREMKNKGKIANYTGKPV